MTTILILLQAVYMLAIAFVIAYAFMFTDNQVYRYLYLVSIVYITLYSIMIISNVYGKVKA